MLIVHRAGDVDTDLEVTGSDATVADLAAALAPGTDPHTTLTADGVALEPGRTLATAGIPDGAVIEVVSASGSARDRGPAPAAAHDTGPRGGWELVVTGGVEAGSTHQIPAAGALIGRDAGCDVRLDDPAVSAQHLRVQPDRDQLTATDLASRNGTWIAGARLNEPCHLRDGDRLRVGRTELTVRRHGVGDTGMRTTWTIGRGRSGTRPFHRPPRVLPQLGLAPVPAPDAPGEPSHGAPVGLVAVLAPVLMGLVLMWVFHSVLWGLFSLLGPVMILGGAWEQRRRGHRSLRLDRLRFRRDLGRFTASLAEVAADATHQRELLAPDVGELRRRAAVADRRLWEGRPDHDDWLTLRLGRGPARWNPPVTGLGDPADPSIAAAVEQAATLSDAPVLVHLGDGAVVGLVGDPTVRVALARSLLVQAAVRHGPADLRLAALADAGRLAGWRWVARLPHTIGASGGPRHLAEGPAAARLSRELLASADGTARPEPGPSLLCVVDAPELLRARRSPLRSLLQSPARSVAAVVLADREEQLPSSCTTVVTVADSGIAEVEVPARAARSGGVLVSGVAETVAAATARRLARWDDPDLAEARDGLPPRIALSTLLHLRGADAAALAARWAEPDAGLTTPLGYGPDGPFAVDLVADGPHLLVAGTTGAGKSELLRTLVVGLAASHSPAEVAFVLVDFKGGSAFAPCADLPHVVGVATDLDEALARRAVTALEGELAHRERVLRDAGAEDLAAYRRAASGAELLPRLVVVIDEFATLAAEHPDVLDGLVGVAQRGRSLGLHLVLATQRPAGSVSDHIRANTNLRIALRVHDPNDSRDVIETPDAAEIRRDQPGRAIVRLGPGELVAVQTALAGGDDAEGSRGVELRPLSRPPGTSEERRPSSAGGELERLVRLCRAAAADAELPAARRVWPDPLPAQLPLAELWSTGCDDPAGAVMALGDDPANQRRRKLGWSGREGHLLILGAPGSGTTTAALACCLSLLKASPPGELHLYVAEMGAPAFGALRPLPQVGAVVTAGEHERRARLVRLLAAEVSRRLRPDAGDSPTLVLALDGVASLLAAHDEPFDPVRAGLDRILADGPGVDVHVLCTARRPGDLPAAWTSLIRHRLVLALTDPADEAMAGVGRGVRLPTVPGRCWWASEGLLAQVGEPDADLGPLVDELRPGAGRDPQAAAPVGALPDRVELETLAGAVADRRDGALDGDAQEVQLPIGIAEWDLSVAVLALHAGDHALVAGPARCGKSSLLRLLAALLGRAGEPDVIAVAAPASPLHDPAAGWRHADPARLAGLLDELSSCDRTTLVLVDDADRVADPDGAIAAALQRTASNVHLVAAVRTTAVRSAFGHWSRSLSHLGVLLAPDTDLDGDLLSVRLPRRPPAAPGKGRGWLVGDGELQYVQCGMA